MAKKCDKCNDPCGATTPCGAGPCGGGGMAAACEKPLMSQGLTPVCNDPRSVVGAAAGGVGAPYTGGYYDDSEEDSDSDDDDGGGVGAQQPGMQPMPMPMPAQFPPPSQQAQQQQQQKQKQQQQQQQQQQQPEGQATSGDQPKEHRIAFIVEFEYEPKDIITSDPSVVKTDRQKWGVLDPEMAMGLDEDARLSVSQMQLLGVSHDLTVPIGIMYPRGLGDGKYVDKFNQRFDDVMSPGQGHLGREVGSIIYQSTIAPEMRARLGAYVGMSVETLMSDATALATDGVCDGYVVNRGTLLGQIIQRNGDGVGAEVLQSGKFHVMPERMEALVSMARAAVFDKGPAPILVKDMVFSVVPKFPANAVAPEKMAEGMQAMRPYAIAALPDGSEQDIAALAYVLAVRTEGVTSQAAIDEIVASYSTPNRVQMSIGLTYMPV